MRLWLVLAMFLQLEKEIEELETDAKNAFNELHNVRFACPSQGVDAFALRSYFLK